MSIRGSFEPIRRPPENNANLIRDPSNLIIPVCVIPSDAPLPGSSRVVLPGMIKGLLAAIPSVVEGPVRSLSNLFRSGIFSRFDSTKSTPSAVIVKSELSAYGDVFFALEIPHREVQIIAGEPHAAFNLGK